MLEARTLAAFAVGGLAGAALALHLAGNRPRCLGSGGGGGGAPPPPALGSHLLTGAATAAAAGSGGGAPRTAESGPAGAAALPPEAILQDDICAEMFTRNIQFFGLEAQTRIAKSFVVVVGLGGVGSHCANFLLRSGVGKLRLIDFDQVTLSSLNRHATAVRADVGRPKAECMAQHCARTFPEATVEAVAAMYEAEREEELLGGAPDFVVDAIDNIDTKVHLLAACKRRGIPVLCSGGAGGKADPTKIRFGDLTESVVDPLCRAVRTQLKKQYNITTGIPVLMSSEKQRCDLVYSGEGENMAEYQVLPNFRVRTIPVLGPVPAIFGMAAAAYVLTELAEQPIKSEPIVGLKMDQYQTIYNRLVARAEEDWGLDELRVDQEDVVYIVKELYGGQSARAKPTPGKGMWRSTHNLELMLWDDARPAEIDNLVLLTRDEAAAHAATTRAAVAAAEPAFAAHVERLLRRARREHGYPGDRSW